MERGFFNIDWQWVLEFQATHLSHLKTEETEATL